MLVGTPLSITTLSLLAYPFRWIMINQQSVRTAAQAIPDESQVLRLLIAAVAVEGAGTIQLSESHRFAQWSGIHLVRYSDVEGTSFNCRSSTPALSAAP